MKLLAYWDDSKEEQYIPPKDPYDTTIVDEHPEVSSVFCPFHLVLDSGRPCSNLHPTFAVLAFSS